MTVAKITISMHLKIANVLLIVLMHILSRAAYAQNHCKDGETEIRDNVRNQTWCFVYENDKPNTYDNASQYCQNKGMTISPARYLQDDVDFLFHPGFTPNNVWVGITREQTYSPWYWSDGVRVDVDWAFWSPWNRWKDKNRPNWSCVWLSYYNRWETKQCSENHDFVCEYKLCPATTWKYNPYTGRCVKYFPYAKTFKDATHFCSQQHNAIVEVGRSARAIQFIKNSIIPQFQYSAGPQPAPWSTVPIYEGMWLGMTDDASDGDWVWNDGAPVHWSNWMPGGGII